MDDELNNHAVFVLEKHDEDDQDVNQDDLQKFFVDATKYPTKKSTLHQLYKEEMEYIENLQCRQTFFNLLAFGYKTYEGVTTDIEMSNEGFAQLQGLIFNELCENQF